MRIGDFIRSSTSTRAVVEGVLASVLFSFSPSAAAPSLYHAIVLPSLDPVKTRDLPGRTVGKALDDQGVVIGEYGFPPQRFIWSSRRGILSAKELSGWDQAFPEGMSNRFLVGFISAWGEAPRAFSVSCGEALKLLPKLREDSGFAASATAVNQEGIVAGWCEIDRPSNPSQRSRHAVIWRNGQITDLDPSGKEDSGAVAVNRAGLVAGNFLEEAVRSTRAFRWSEDCGPEGLPPMQVGFPTAAFDLNDAGSIVGFTEAMIPGKGTVRLASLWSPENQLSILPFSLISKAGSDSAEALAINNRGQVVGQQRELGTFKMHAILWEGGQGYALKNLVADLPAGYSLDRAVGINERGEILLNGFYQMTSQFVAILLTPIVSEPSATGSSHQARSAGGVAGTAFPAKLVSTSQVSSQRLE